MSAKGWIICAAALLLGACGSDATFTAEDFIEEANANGAGLVLGTELASDRSGVSVHTVEVSEEQGNAHGGGSLTVLEDSDAGLAEYERCNQGVSLVCFRAANIVLIFGGTLTPDQQAALEDALRAMAA